MKISSYSLVSLVAVAILVCGAAFAPSAAEAGGTRRTTLRDNAGRYQGTVYTQRSNVTVVDRAGRLVVTAATAPLRCVGGYCRQR